MCYDYDVIHYLLTQTKRIHNSIDNCKISSPHSSVFFQDKCVRSVRTELSLSIVSLKKKTKKGYLR